MKSLFLVFTGVLNLFAYTSIAADVYADNQYGATLAFKINDAPKEIRVDAGEKKMLGSTSFGAVLSNLKIRTTGTGSTVLSPYKDISFYLKQIEDEQGSHNDQDAYLVIQPSSFDLPLAWNIKVEWR